MSRLRASRHGSTSSAIDAGRGLTSPRGGTAARLHLASCGRCRENVNLWKSFALVTRRLREAEPPPEAVDQAKGLALGPAGVTPLTRVKTALGYERLWLPPAAAGARGAPSDQAVYEAEEYSVDLRVSRESSRVVIVGQITNVRRPTKHFGEVRVTLIVGEQVVVRAFATHRGEFRVEHGEHDRMWIEVAPQEGRLIRIPVRPRQIAS
ncbi:MAG TPA: hypothetical protein VFK70_16050 [Vicinamibacteria bacterium]|nr:hypothetical protein [Vicinamibacteria bacterium]